MPKGIYIRTTKYRKEISERNKRLGIKPPIKKGMHTSPKTEFKKGQCFGSNNTNWKGGRTKRYGYVLTYSPNHPKATKQGYVFEHRLVMEHYLQRYLTPKERTHHLGKRDDNRIFQLMLFNCSNAHFRFHKGQRVEPFEIVFDGRKLRPQI